MQEYEMLLEDFVAQLKAGFAEMERRHQGKIAKLQQGHKEEIECIHHCYDDKIASVKYELDTERQKIIDLQKNFTGMWSFSCFYSKGTIKGTIIQLNNKTKKTDETDVLSKFSY